MFKISTLVCQDHAGNLTRLHAVTEKAELQEHDQPIKDIMVLHSFTGKVLQMVLKKSFYKLCSSAWDKVVHPATDKQLYLEI